MLSPQGPVLLSLKSYLQEKDLCLPAVGRFDQRSVFNHAGMHVTCFLLHAAGIFMALVAVCQLELNGISLVSIFFIVDHCSLYCTVLPLCLAI